MFLRCAVISRVTALLFASKAVNAPFVLPVQPLSSESDSGRFSACGSNHSARIPALVGTALGGTCGGALLAVCILWMAQKRRTRRDGLAKDACGLGAQGTLLSFKG